MPLKKEKNGKDPANDTGGIFYCCNTAEINGSGSLQTPLVAMWHGRPSWPPVKEKEYKIKSSWDLQRKILIFREA